MDKWRKYSVKEGFDLAVRIGKPKESGLKIKRVGEVVLVLVASPKYLNSNSKIKRPEDLKSHLCLALGQRGGSKDWRLGAKTTSTKVAIRPSIVSNQMSSLLRAALADAGVAFVPGFLCNSFIQSGQLERVLPNWCSPGLPVSLLSPLPFSSSARLRVVSDALASELQRALTACR